MQGWSADEVPIGEDRYESFTCLACTQMHFVNRTTGKVVRRITTNETGGRYAAAEFQMRAE